MDWKSADTQSTGSFEISTRASALKPAKTAVSPCIGRKNMIKPRWFEVFCIVREFLGYMWKECILSYIVAFVRLKKLFCISMKSRTISGQNVSFQCWFGRNVTCDQRGRWTASFTNMGVCHTYTLSKCFLPQKPPLLVCTIVDHIFHHHFSWLARHWIFFWFTRDSAFFQTKIEQLKK